MKIVHDNYEYHVTVGDTIILESEELIMECVMRETEITEQLLHELLDDDSIAISCRFTYKEEL